MHARQILRRVVPALQMAAKLLHLCRGYDVVAPMPAAEQRGRALLRAGRADGAALSKVREHTARYMQRLHRMLRLEESAMETDITRCNATPRNIHN